MKTFFIDVIPITAQTPLTLKIKHVFVDRCATNTRVFIISEKVNGIVKANTNFLKNAFEYAHY